MQAQLFIFLLAQEFRWCKVKELVAQSTNKFCNEILRHNHSKINTHRAIPVSTGILPHSLPEWAFRANVNFRILPCVCRLSEFHHQCTRNGL